MSIKRHLNALLHRTRGGHSFHKVRASIENMDEQEAQEWYRFITNAVDEAKMQAKSRARNQGGFFASQSKKDINIEDLIAFLKRGYYGPAGKAWKVREGGNWGSGLIEWVTIDPEYRERLDHYGNDGDGWDQESWWKNYADPTQNAAQKQLDKEFGKDFLRASIGEKGDIYVHWNDKKVNMIIPSKKSANTIQERVASRYLNKKTAEEDKFKSCK